MAIVWTSNYGRFLANGVNRNIEKAEKLMESMKKHGYIEAYPLDVRRTKGDKLLVRDGHHRLHCAKSLGIKLAYVITNDSATITEIVGTQNGWSLKNWLQSHRRNGTGQDYEVIARFMDTYLIPISAAIKLLHSGEGLGKKYDMSRAFRDGKFKIGDIDFAVRVAEIVKLLRAKGFDFVSKIGFIECVKRLCKVCEFDENRLIDKATRNRSKFINQPSMKNFMEMIEDIYNYRCSPSEKVPLCILAERKRAEMMMEAAKRMQQSKGFKTKKAKK